MKALQTAIGIAWAVFWIYWLLSAVNAKASTGGMRRLPMTGLTVVCVFVLVRVFRGGGSEVHSLIVATVGAVLFVCGIGLAIWARIHLGRNWGMPMTQRVQPELVTSGPYRFVRHPIYSGLLLALVGTALANNFLGLIIAVVLGAYFYYAATVEERNLMAAFPTDYPAYRQHTKKLIPFLL
ncbi:MAG TPA: isoprenylcysteine carboxylmethyltransferase family protein [Solirubrobacteraceae bacterium]|nr:isoprenylcysteine carboxylmethyltransferase family protein [Solirubrobacteraceae bacterium]